MTRATFTVAQAAEISNTFWDISYTATLEDGSTVTGLYSDDLVKEIPAAAVVIGELGVVTDGNGTVIGYACEHPDLTDEDATLIKFELDWRAQKMADIAALPSADRPTARTALRTEIRQTARADARKAARIALRQADRQAARKQYREDLRAAAVAAGKLPA
jgi:hypothetical protein